jgi:hypothetical protein
MSSGTAGNVQNASSARFVLGGVGIKNPFHLSCALVNTFLEIVRSGRVIFRNNQLGEVLHHPVMLWREE